MSLLDTLSFIMNHPLNRDRKLAAVAKWFAWQISSRLMPGPRIVPFVNDSKLLVSHGMRGATGNLYTGLHEFNDMSFCLHLLRPGSLFVDVGANVGSYTVLASAAIGARSIAIEPIRSSYEALRRNVKLNNIEDKVDLRNIGAADQKGILCFTSDQDTLNHVLTNGDISGKNSVQIEVDTLDCIAGDLKPVLIKIDVEGYEDNVIMGANRVLAKDSLLAVILELNGFAEAKTHQRMLHYGFKPFRYEPFERILVPLSEQARNGNTLYVRNEANVKDRLSAAPTFLVNGRRI